MIEGTIQAVNNAKVLYGLNLDRSEVESVENIFSLTPLLQETINNPTIPKEVKVNIIGKVFSSENISEKLIRFLQVMCKNNQADDMKAIFEQYYLYYDQMNKIIHAKLICTSPFTDAEKQEADNILKEKYADYKVILTQEIDDTLLGGYVLKIGNHEYDKSYKERLRQLQEKITGR